jgi:alkylhydroperoxidase family enzyme
LSPEDSNHANTIEKPKTHSSRRPGHVPSPHREAEGTDDEAGVCDDAPAIRQGADTAEGLLRADAAEFGQFYGKISALDKKLHLPPETAMLIREQVARTNVCLFCVDIGRWFTIKVSMNEAKFNPLDQYRSSYLFSDAERAALDYLTELTKDKQVNPSTFARVSSCYSERAICEMVWLVASEHFYNLTNIGLNIHSDMLCKVGNEKN